LKRLSKFLELLPAMVARGGGGAEMGTVVGGCGGQVATSGLKSRDRIATTKVKDKVDD
jgi:hypothetical protein